ncbi:DUF262 domain-containing protein [Clostridium perfringens]|uniref:DUF262 domain-containing protein n=1 Tax=Clostridium perfringens TaxID=1502 RepID=UPI001242D64D|nr:DUF262 domain-containing protein [Clostridium perfringens]
MSRRDIDNMTAAPRNLEGIFKDSKKFKVPIFQRDYSWNEENWQELWNDIEEGVTESRSHYLGSVVLVNNDDVKEIIDGQQRLTTLSILIKAIHFNISQLIDKNIDKDNNNDRLALVSQFIMNKDIYNPEEITNTINLNKTNNNVYSRYILKDEEVGRSEFCKSNQLLINCYKFFKNKFKLACFDKEIGNININKLLDYFKYITQKILVVEIVVSDYANAYVIFETLNDRGMALTVTDLLKNYLFSKVEETKHDSLYIIWNKIIDNVEEKNIAKFIRHYWNCKNKKITEKELFKTLKKYIEGKNISVYNFLSELEKVSEIYGALSNPEHKMWKNDQIIKEYIKEIQLYKVELCYPVMLATELFITEINLKRKIYKLCSRISFRYITISKGAPGDLESAYNELCLAIFKNNNSLNMVEQSDKMRKFIVADEEFIAAFSNKEISTRGNKKLIKYIIEKIEESINGTGKILSGYTIEHVLPESANEEWDKIFDNNFKFYRYRLGNYVLLESKYNSEIGNELFAVKKEVYSKSSYKTAKNLSTLSEWNIQKMEENQRRMAIVANSIWSYK